MYFLQELWLLQQWITGRLGVRGDVCTYVALESEESKKLLQKKPLHRVNLEEATLLGKLMKREN